MENNGDLLTQRRAGCLQITLNRPAKLNSFTAAMLDSLLVILQNAADDVKTRVILLTGNGRAFCAGQDLSDRYVVANKENIDLGLSLEKRYNPLIRAIRDIPKPVVCAVNGVAAGAGANVALACDIVIAAQSAVFVQAFSRIGLVPDSGGSWLLPRLAGGGRAAALAMLAEKVPAQTAAEWGMIWQVVEDEQLTAVSHDITQRLVNGSATAQEAIKSLLNTAQDNPLSQQLMLEIEHQRRCGHSADYHEGVTAFMEKRQPRFNQ